MPIERTFGVLKQRTKIMRGINRNRISFMLMIRDFSAKILSVQNEDLLGSWN
jgi:hypothetical protein